MPDGITIPDGADDWPFEAKAATISEANKLEDIRSAIDAKVGIPDPSWQSNDNTPGSFTKYELTLLLLALGGPDHA